MWRGRCWIVAGLLLILSWSALADATDDSIKKLKDLDPAERQIAVAELSYGSPSAKALEALLETVSSDPDSSVVSAAIEAVGTLAKSAPDNKPYLDALLGLLARKDSSLALLAAAALEPLEEKTSQVQRMELYAAALGGDPDLRSLAFLGLTRNTGPESFALLSKLIEPAPLDEDALLALYAKPGTKGENVCAARLAKGLEAGEGADFDLCFALANRISEKKEVLLPVMHKLAAGMPDLEQRLDVALTLYRWEPGRPRLEPILELLQAPAGLTGENLSKVISNLQQADFQYIQAPLAKAFPSITDEQLLSTVMDALAVPGPREEETMAALMSHKGNPSALIRAKVAKNAILLGVASGRSQQALLELMKDPELEVAVIAATSYFKLTSDKAPVVEVFRRAAKSEVGPQMLYTNVDAEVAYPLSEELFDLLLPLAKSGDGTARQVLPPLLEHLGPQRLADILAIYPDLDADSRTMYLSSLSSVHIARPGVRAFLEKLTASEEPYEAYAAAQLLFQKAGDSAPMVKLARKGLTSGSPEEILQAVNHVVYDGQLASMLLPELEAALLALPDAGDRSSVVTGLLQTEGRASGVKYLLQALRDGDYRQLSGFFYDSALAAELAPLLQKAELQKLASYLGGYSKDPRLWETELGQAVFVCLLLKEADAAAMAGDTLRFLAANHSSELIRSYASEALGVPE